MIRHRLSVIGSLSCVFDERAQALRVFSLQKFPLETAKSKARDFGRSSLAKLAGQLQFEYFAIIHHLGGRGCGF